MKRVHDLVLDAGALIRLDVLRLGQGAERVWTVPQVLDEVRDERARLALAALPFEITPRMPSAESMRAVTAFARETGDYAALSKTDLLVIALVHTIHAERNPELAREQARQAAERAAAAAAAPPPPPPAAASAALPALAEPKPVKTWGAVLKGEHAAAPSQSPWRINRSAESPGETSGKAGAQDAGEDFIGASEWPGLPSAAPKPGIHPLSSLLAASSSSSPTQPLDASVSQSRGPKTSDFKGEEEEEDDHDQDLLAHTGEESERVTFAQSAEAPRERPSRILSNAIPAPTTVQVDEEDEKAGGEWAAPGKPLDATSGWAQKVQTKEAPVIEVACATGDFAMQNVLLQMHLRVVTVDGLKAVTKLSHWVLKCDSCFTITPADTTRLFCPACGKATLARLAYSIDAKGVRHYHYSKNRKINTRGARFSVPKDANLLLCEDQLLTGIWAQRANKKTDSSSIFGNDVNETMGVPMRQAVSLSVGFGSHNPNEAKGRERRGKAKPKSKFAAPRGGQRSLFES